MKKLRNSIYILIFLGMVNTNIIADELPKLFINEIANTGVKLLCNDFWFLTSSRINKNKCIDILNNYSKECNSLIIPLVPPEITGDNDGLKSVKIMGNLGELYSMCLISLTFQAFQAKGSSHLFNNTFEATLS